MNETYPSIDNENFNYIISKHPDFNKFKTIFDNYTLEKIKELTEDKCNSSGGYIYKNIQLFVSSFLSLNTPYNGLLLYHGVGVGKTCSSLLISDNFKDYVKKNNKKIIILTKPAIQEGYMNEIFNYKNYINNIDKNIFSCISNEYIDDWNDWKNKYESDKYESFRNIIVNNYFEIYGYQEFTNKYKNIKNKDGTYDKIQINNLFSDSVLVIDEVHNLRDENVDENDNNKIINVKESKEFLNSIFENLDSPIKLILLSATPMYDKYDEFEFIINLLRKNDNKPPLNIQLLHNIINETNKTKLETFKTEFYTYVRGYISYIKGNDPFIFPKILYPNNYINIYFKEHSTSMPIIKCIMSSYQKKIYKSIKSNNDKSTVSNHNKSKFASLVFPLNSIYDTDKISFTSMYNFNELFKYNSKLDKYTIINKDIVSELFNNIQKYSCKFYNLINNLYNPILSNGKIFIYSTFIDEKLGGGKFISILLEKLGFQRKIVTRNKLEINNALNQKICDEFNNFYYIRLDGDTPVKHRNIYLDNFNNNNNINGEKIKIIIGSRNLFEGVSFLNLREIHIMEPWYNKSRYEQIIGRGYRQCSHKMLPFENRNLTIYNYVAFSKDITTLIDNNNYIINNDKINDIDLRKIQLANKKMDDILKLDYLIKFSSIDCILNKNINNLQFDIIQSSIKEPFDKDLINIISQTNSKNQNKLIKLTNYPSVCLNEDIDLQINFNNNNIFTNPKFINNIKYFIKIVFIESNLNYFTIDYLYNKTLEKYNNFDINLFKIALQELILNKEKIYNKFNQPGYFTINKSYIIFKPENTFDINIPIEFIQFPFKTKLNNINFYDTFTLNITNKDIFKKIDTTTKIDPIKNKNSDKSISNSSEINQNEEYLLNFLLKECYDNPILNKLSQNYESFQNYKKLIIKLKPISGKHSPNFNISEETSDKVIESNLRSLIVINKKKYDNSLINKLLKNLFYITDINNINLSYDNIFKLHEINLKLIFIFNFHPFIITTLKCIFYKNYISSNTLSSFETHIFNYYKNLIVSTNPLIFKFIDFSKNNLNNYNYKYLQNIYYEYNDADSIWITHQYDIEKKPFLTKININDTSYNFYKITVDPGSPLSNKDFVLEQLNINSEDFNYIYDTFNYNNYSSYNDGYFYYTGDFNNPFETDKLTKITKHPKFSNIIGFTNINLTDTNYNLKSNMSRIMFNIGIIFSRYIDNKNIYFKGSHNSNGFNNHLPGLKVYMHIIHIIYCIIDQIIELNYKIILNIILNYPSNINEIWNSINNKSIPNKYLFKDLFNFDFKKSLFNFSKEQFVKLDNFLNTEFQISIKKKYSDINQDVIQNKNLLYDYTPILNILEYFNNYHTISSVGDKPKNKLNFKEKEHYYSKLLVILLYDLDNSKFYKRWLLNFYESTLLNPKVLNINIKPKTKYFECKNNRCGDTTSIPNKSTFNYRLKMDKSSNKYIDLDS